jgi:hypothetical protein
MAEFLITEELIYERVVRVEADTLDEALDMTNDENVEVINLIESMRPTLIGVEEIDGTWSDQPPTLAEPEQAGESFKLLPAPRFGS